MIIRALAITIIFCGYALIIRHYFGVLKSVSTSTRFLEGNKKIYFYLTLGAMGWINLDMGMEEWGAFASVGIMASGISYYFYSQRVEFWVHYIGTVGAILLTFIGFIDLFGLWQPAVAAALVNAWLFFKAGENRVWYIEIATMIIAGTSYIYIYW